jgi:thioredoxin reductase
VSDYTSQYNDTTSAADYDADYDVVVIGGGPAGLAAVTYALKSHLNVALVAPELGGKVSYTFALRHQPPVDSVWGADLVHQFETYVKTHLDHHVCGKATQVTARPDGSFRIDVDMADPSAAAQSLGARTVIVGTGASPQRLYVPGEQKYWGTGVSFSAISHASLFRDRTVLVVGYGERALVAALHLAALAEHTYFIATSMLDESNALVQQLYTHPAVSVLNGWQLLRIEGDEYVNRVTIAKEYEIQSLDVEGVFIEMGLIPDKEFLRGLLKFDPETGHIPINQRCETDIPGLFAAGDVTNVYAEQVPVAIGEGVKAALSAWEYLTRQTSLSQPPAPVDREKVAG